MGVSCFPPPVIDVFTSWKKEKDKNLKLGAFSKFDTPCIKKPHGEEIILNPPLFKRVQRRRALPLPKSTFYTHPQFRWDLLGIDHTCPPYAGSTHSGRREQGFRLINSSLWRVECSMESSPYGSRVPCMDPLCAKFIWHKRGWISSTGSTGSSYWYTHTWCSVGNMHVEAQDTVFVYYIE